MTFIKKNENFRQCSYLLWTVLPVTLGALHHPAPIFNFIPTGPFWLP